MFQSSPSVVLFGVAEADGPGFSSISHTFLTNGSVHYDHHHPFGVHLVHVESRLFHAMTMVKHSTCSLRFESYQVYKVGE